MFRKPTKARAVRQREETTNVADEEAAQIIKGGVRKKRRENPFVQSCKRQKKDGVESDSSSDDEAESEPASSAGPSNHIDVGTADVDTDQSIDAQAQFERVQQQLKEGGVEKDGKILYKGLAMYGAKEAQDTSRGNASSKFNRVGPIRAPQFVKRTIRWDYAPDICKDYKETGFCTFGDSCKFLHDRSDYKHGWEIERDYEAGTLNEVDETNYEIPEEEDNLPDDCFICGNPFENPVVTSLVLMNAQENTYFGQIIHIKHELVEFMNISLKLCKHYFCEACAISAFRKSKKCRVCEQNTGGVFNVAKEIIEKMHKRNEKSEKSDNSDEDEAETKCEIKSEPHEHACDDHSHSHDLPTPSNEEKIDEKIEQEAEENDEPNNHLDSLEESTEDAEMSEEPQEEVAINMESVEEDDDEIVDDEEDYDEGEEPEPKS